MSTVKDNSLLSGFINKMFFGFVIVSLFRYVTDYDQKFREENLEIKKPQ